MSKRIAFVTPNSHQGQVPRTFANMRTEFAWQCALNADHYNLFDCSNIDSYDAIVFIPPKTWDERTVSIVMNLLLHKCGFLWFMQEGPYNYWHRYNLEQQDKFLDIINACDGILCHNKNDVGYYKGLIGRDQPVHNLNTLLIEDAIPEEDNFENSRNRAKHHCLIGGTFTEWYGGHDSYLVASNSGLQLIAPSMGRINEGEQEFNRQEKSIEYLPYVNWSQWMSILSRYPKIGVHLMPTFGAGTFALNCAYYGIPCIGYTYLDTQRILFPSASIELPNLFRAQETIQMLAKVDQVYEYVSRRARENYLQYYCEEVWLQTETVCEILATASS